MFNADRYWITIAELKGFSEQANDVFTMSEWEALTQCLSVNPGYGEIIPETGGVRVVKWPAASQGKGGHVRVVYYFRDLNIPVYMLAIYERGERLNLTSADKRIIRALVEEVVASYCPIGMATWVFPSGAA
jgi:hypothetical protein